MKRTIELSLMFMFLLSGLTSLVYETIWIRALSWSVGSTSGAMSMVLGIFFIGLSIGCYLSNKFMPRFKSPLIVYGIIEAAIGLYSIPGIYIFLLFPKLMAYLPGQGIGTQFLCVAAVLAFPTLCMGASLPLLVELIARRNPQSGKYVSILYGLNTIGASLGTILTGFVLIPTLGLTWSNHAAAALNFCIFFGCLYLGRNILHDKRPLRALATLAPEIKDKSPKLSSHHWLLILTAGVTGFSSLACEVVWAKYLGIFLGTNLFGLSLVLGLFLFGIALGSILVSRFIERVQEKERLLVILLFGASVLILLTSTLLNFAPTIANVLTYGMSEIFTLFTMKTLVAIVLLVPPTLLFGALFPLTIQVLYQSQDDAVRATSRAYVVNTAGSIVGSVLTGLLFVPTWGSSRAIQIATAVLITVMLLLLFSPGWTRSFRVAVSFASAGILGVVLMLPSIDFKNIVKTAYVQSYDGTRSLTDLVKFFSKNYEEFLLLIEGKSGVISLSHDPQDGEAMKTTVRLKTNGLNESVYSLTDLDQLPKYEALLGLLPFLYSQGPKSAFVVGYGGGYTVNFLSQQSIPKIVVAELESGILKAADWIHRGNNPILKRSNVSIVIDDARHALTTRKQGPFDIIVSQPSHPWLAGVANLFTQEYFQIVKQNLTDEGVFSQWLNLYNMNEDALKSILKTFFTEFPHGAVFTDAQDQELIMIGSLKPLQFNVQTAQMLLNNPVTKKMLTWVPFNSISDLLANFSLSRKQVIALTEQSPLNTDTNAFAEVRQVAVFYQMSAPAGQRPQDFLSRNYAADFEEIYPVSESERANLYYKVLVSLQEGKKFDKLHRLLRLWEPLSRSEQQRGYLCLQSQRYRSADRALDLAMQKHPSPEGLNMQMINSIAMGAPDKAVKSANRHRSLLNPINQCLFVEALSLTERGGEAQSMVTQMIARANEYEVQCGNYFHKVLGTYFYERRDYQRALGYLEKYYASSPKDLATLEMLIATYFHVRSIPNARQFAKYYDLVALEEHTRLSSLAQFYRSEGLIEDASILDTLSQVYATPMAQP